MAARSFPRGLPASLIAARAPNPAKDFEYVRRRHRPLTRSDRGHTHVLTTAPGRRERRVKGATLDAAINRNDLFVEHGNRAIRTSRDAPSTLAVWSMQSVHVMGIFK